MKKITVYGKEYPVRMTMGAMRRFKQQTDVDVSRMGTDLSLMVVLLYCCVVSACNADDVEFTLDIDKFADGLEIDALNSFAESLQGDTDDTKKKTEELPPPTLTN